MIQTETSKAKIIFKDLPSNANRFKVFNDEKPYLSYFVGVETLREFLPQGNWTILNVLDGVTEDEAEMVADDFLFMFTKEGFKSYLSYDIGLRTATESLHSLATSLGVEGKTIILYELK